MCSMLFTHPFRNEVVERMKEISNIDIGMSETEGKFNLIIMFKGGYKRHYFQIDKFKCRQLANHINGQFE